MALKALKVHQAYRVHKIFRFIEYIELRHSSKWTLRSHREMPGPAAAVHESNVQHPVAHGATPTNAKCAGGTHLPGCWPFFAAAFTESGPKPETRLALPRMSLLPKAGASCVPASAVQNQKIFI